MNVFILGLPKSGKTTVAKCLEQSLGFKYLNVSNWVKNTFRKQEPDEHEQHFKEEFNKHFFSLLKETPTMCCQYAASFMHVSDVNFVIEGIMSPRDFIELFNVDKDIVVFLNRTDNDEFFQDHENIALPTMRDYCFWASSIGSLPKQRWLEYNFKLNGEDSDYVKNLGAKNSVFLVKSINNVMSHLQDNLKY
jgi:hypothetical protein